MAAPFVVSLSNHERRIAQNQRDPAFILRQAQDERRHFEIPYVIPAARSFP
jgi:hypothetical protein